MGLGTLDTILLVISLTLSAGIGIYQGIKGIKATPTDYLLGGRMMSPIPLAMSLTVGTLSAITIMGNAGEMYSHGTQLWLMDIGLAFGMYVVAKVFLPIFYPLKMVSLYHFIEWRFKSVWLRRTTVLLTLLGAYTFIGFLLYPPSLFLQSFTGLTTTQNIVITGLACSIYSSVGGVKAVVYTDVLQSIIMIIGSLTIVIQGASEVGGFEKAWDIAYHRGRIEFFNMSMDPYQRHSFWLVITYGFFFSLSTYGVNQSQTQRTFSTASVAQAQKVMYYAIVGILILKSLINLSGIVIFAVFADCDPLTAGGKMLPNLVVTVSYVLRHLTKIPGLSGLFVASIYAAVLSSVSTQVNSMTALIWEDFLKYLPIFEGFSEIKVARIQKVIVLLTGIIGIFMSLIAAKFSSYLRTLLQITGALWGPMVGLFFVAVYLPWVNVKGASSGFFLAIVISMWIVIGQLATQQNPLYLPMSHEGCPAPPSVSSTLPPTNETLQNVTLDEITTQISLIEEGDLLNVTFANETDSVEMNPISIQAAVPSLNQGTGFYGISYCLNYCWGVIACLFVSAIVTAFTGANTPLDVDARLIDPTSWTVFTMGVMPYLKERVFDELRGIGFTFGCIPGRKKSRSVSTDHGDANQDELQPMGKQVPEV